MVPEQVTRYLIGFITLLLIGLMDHEDDDSTMQCQPYVLPEVSIDNT